MREHHEPQPAGDRLPVDVEEPRDEQGQDEHQHAAGDAEQEVEDGFEEDAEIGAERDEGGAEVRGPRVPDVGYHGAEAGDAGDPGRGQGQAGAKRFLDPVAEMVDVVGALGGGEAERKHDDDGRQQHHDQGGDALPQAEAMAQPVEHRPGGEGQDGGPEQGGEERIEHQEAAGGQCAEQHPE